MDPLVSAISRQCPLKFSLRLTGNDIWKWMRGKQPSHNYQLHIYYILLRASVWRVIYRVYNNALLKLIVVCVSIFDNKCQTHVSFHKCSWILVFSNMAHVCTYTNDEMEEIRARILAANNDYSSLQTIFRSKQIHRNNTIRLYKTLIKPILCYGSVTWTLTQTSEQMLNTFERKILRRICGLTHKGGCWCSRWNNELYSLYKELNIVEDIKIRRLEWAGHIIRMEEERIQKRF